jgi:serine/threonine protein kinase
MNESTSIVCDEARACAAAPSAGDVVAGKYRLLRPLGEGGMGVVFEAEHLRLRQLVALKFLKADVLAMPDAVERFEREARASCRMRGPHVVHVLDVDTDEDGRPFMVMERLRGRDLEAELSARGALPIPEAVDIVLQACAAAGEAHAAGIVHRDLKPSNLFLAEEAGGRVVKVLDFGISKIARDAEPAVTSTYVTVGTPLYMSPEQVRSSRDVDGRTDIWSLGVILYELIAGDPPFFGTTTAAIAAIVADATPSLRDVRPEVPEQLERAIMTALAKAPEDRFPSAEAFGASLLAFASAEGIAGPFSIRPSQQAFEIASSAMRRIPVGTRASAASDLLRLPRSRKTRRVPPGRTRRQALHGLFAMAVVGGGLAAAGVAALCSSHGARAADGSTASRTTTRIERDSAPPAAAVPAGADTPRSHDARTAPQPTTIARPHPAPSQACPPAPPSKPWPGASAQPPTPTVAPRARAEVPHGPVQRPLYL